MWMTSRSCGNSHNEAQSVSWRQDHKARKKFTRGHHCCHSWPVHTSAPPPTLCTATTAAPPYSMLLHPLPLPETRMFSPQNLPQSPRWMHVIAMRQDLCPGSKGLGKQIFGDFTFHYDKWAHFLMETQNMRSYPNLKRRIRWWAPKIKPWEMYITLRIRQKPSHWLFLLTCLPLPLTQYSSQATMSCLSKMQLWRCFPHT